MLSPRDSWWGLPGDFGESWVSRINTPSHESGLSCKVVHSGLNVWIWIVKENVMFGDLVVLATVNA
jgi:hypothetical protein